MRLGAGLGQGLCFFLSIAALLCLGFYGLSQTHGLHYDEAVFAQISLDIAAGQSTPFMAMTAHTMAWSHYLAAACLWLFGPSLFVFRAAYLGMGLLGLVLVGASLWRLGQRRMAIVFLALCSATPALLLYLRHAVEVTGFFVLIAGLSFFVLSDMHLREKRAGSLKDSLYLYVFAISALLWIGVTSHVLFLAFPLAGFLWLAAKGRLWGPLAFRVCCLLTIALLPFFAYMLLESKWFYKSLALLAASSAMLMALIFRIKPPSWFRFEQKEFLFALLILGITPAFNVLLFFEVNWSQYYFIGFQPHPWFSGLQMLMLLGLALYSQIKWDFFNRVGSDLSLFLYSLVLCLGALTVVQSPRSYILAFVFLLLLLAMQVVRFSGKRAGAIFLGLWLALGWGQMLLNYYGPGKAHENRERRYTFGVLQESSFDNLSQWPIMRYLWGQSCRFDPSMLADQRLQKQFEVFDRLEGHRHSAQFTEPCAYEGEELEIFRAEAFASNSGWRVLHRSAGFVLARGRKSP